MRRFNASTSFLDIIFNILISFFALFMFTLILINEPTKKGDVVLKAEYLVTVEWPNKSKDDVDVFVKTPLSDTPVYYSNRDIKTASLDRDDLGQTNDKIFLSDGKVLVIEENWEHVAIRKMVKGEYIVNVLMFSKIDKGVTPVTVKIERLNPYHLVYSGTTMLSETKQEETVLRFKMDSKGKIISKSQLAYPLVPNLKVTQPTLPFVPNSTGD